jgi:hypothetical protein
VKTERFDEIKKLLDAAKRLDSIVPSYNECLKDSRCDKHDLKFSAGSDMSVFMVQVGLTCYTGYYGSSSCGTLTSVDKALAQEFLVGALNKRMNSILADMADLARIKAAKMKAEAQKEIDAAVAVMNEL